MKKLVTALCLMLTACAGELPKNGARCMVSECDPATDDTAFYCMEDTFRGYTCRGGCFNSSRESSGIACDPRGAEPGERCPPPLGRSLTCSGRREILECVNGLWQVIRTCENGCFVDTNGVNAKCNG